METEASKRQEIAVAELAKRVERHPHFRGAVLVGSMVAGTADALSDVDCVLIANEHGFDRAWADRCSLHGPAVTVCWDQLDENGPRNAGAHKWLDVNLVFVDCLITAANSGVRLAPPHRVIAGPPELPSDLEPRPPVDRGEMTGIGSHLLNELDVEMAYDILKEVVRRHRRRG